MRKQITLLAMLMVCAAVSLTGCKKDKDVDLSGIHTTAVETTPVAESMAPETTAAIKIEAKETTAAGKDAMIPAVGDFVDEVNIEEKYVKVKLIPGLIDEDATEVRD